MLPRWEGNILENFREKVEYCNKTLLTYAYQARIKKHTAYLEVNWIWDWKVGDRDFQNLLPFAPAPVGRPGVVGRLRGVVGRLRGVIGRFRGVIGRLGGVIGRFGGVVGGRWGVVGRFCCGNAVAVTWSTISTSSSSS